MQESTITWRPTTTYQSLKDRERPQPQQVTELESHSQLVVLTEWWGSPDFQRDHLPQQACTWLRSSSTLSRKFWNSLVPMSRTEGTKPSSLRTSTFPSEVTMSSTSWCATPPLLKDLSSRTFMNNYSPKKSRKWSEMQDKINQKPRNLCEIQKCFMSLLLPLIKMNKITLFCKLSKDLFFSINNQFLQKFMLCDLFNNLF